mmetsp:Transcript_65383/g.77398  ORF Transcript_65383/g.77398 Transcript_65383/m.77398 type:complete len:134 (-) Transcript_65383:57-458(-)|eukprot:CAMPEP_0172484758 /NCGR_PEP_ID=MMETSP1066-20121228/12358_1 /TAXON_ID=671091 /ORGANISM="Coscinodiscus wailesii, Strain CCMP2513" /LENGTH=133 /DNA_ID=CAMNT_0013249493 /DNA_START=118 /DNA_END=519 /DNA_ORIENTATION=+
MADDLASAIVTASEKIQQRDDQFNSVATVNALPFRLEKRICVRGIKENSEIYFKDVESAVNFLHVKGYAQMDVREEDKWKEVLGIARSYAGQKQGKIVLVYSKWNSRREIRRSSEGIITATSTPRACDGVVSR